MRAVRAAASTTIANRPADELLLPSLPTEGLPSTRRPDLRHHRRATPPQTISRGQNPRRQPGPNHLTKRRHGVLEALTGVQGLIPARAGRTQSPHDRRPPPPGLIPARAGRTTSSSGCKCCGRAHPRAGGADPNSSSAAMGPLGSSPRGRGGLTDALDRANGIRLIPARAGRTEQIRRLEFERGAHPRAGGADRIEELRERIDEGSSPRGRGGHGACDHLTWPQLGRCSSRILAPPGR